VRCRPGTDDTHLAHALKAVKGARKLAEAAPLTHKQALAYLEHEHGHTDDHERRRIFHAVRRHAKAFVVNRIGDFGFLLGIFAVYFIFGSLQFDAVFAGAPDIAGNTIEFLGWQVDALTVTCVLLFIGAMGKSAQIGLHTWLPDAMEGRPRSPPSSMRRRW